MHAAIEHDVPIVAALLAGRGYEASEMPLNLEALRDNQEVATALQAAGMDRSAFSLLVSKLQRLLPALPMVELDLFEKSSFRTQLHAAVRSVPPPLALIPLTYTPCAVPFREHQLQARSSRANQQNRQVALALALESTAQWRMKSKQAARSFGGRSSRTAQGVRLTRGPPRAAGNA
jgi:hypothetical protein